MSDVDDATRLAIDRHVERCIALLREAAALPSGEPRDGVMRRARATLDDALDLLEIFAAERDEDDSELHARVLAVENLRALVDLIAAHRSP